MNRTTIVLPDDLKAEAIRQAKSRGVSFGELVRDALQRLLREPEGGAEQRERQAAIESMLRFGREAAPGPSDLAERLDDYVYGDAAARGER